MECGHQVKPISDVQNDQKDLDYEANTFCFVLFFVEPYLCWVDTINSQVILHNYFFHIRII